MPQFDVSFYSSQIFWMIICLCALIWAFKNIFIPRMNDVISRRSDHISKYSKQTEVIEKEIICLKNDIASLKEDEMKKTAEIIKRAIKNADEMMNNQLRAVKEENDALINGTRARLTEEVKNTETNAGANIDGIASEMFNHLFSNKLHVTKTER